MEVVQWVWTILAKTKWITQLLFHLMANLVVITIMIGVVVNQVPLLIKGKVITIEETEAVAVETSTVVVGRVAKSINIIIVVVLRLLMSLVTTMIAAAETVNNVGIIATIMIQWPY